MTSQTVEKRGRVLVVEDEEPIRELVCFHLDLAGYECVGLGEGKEALREANERPYDLLVLDIALPGIDGVTLCRAVRRAGPNRDVPILMLTARRDESEKVIGLESGADDYRTKPFGLREFIARAQALMRRRGATRETALRVVTHPGLEVDPARRRVVCDGRPVALTPQEFNLLFLLASNPGIVFTRQDILAKVWEESVFVTERGVDALVKRLRRKIEQDPARPARIVTVRGTGYKLEEA